jgi:hypothetical protein
MLTEYREHGTRICPTRSVFFTIGSTLAFSLACSSVTLAADDRPQPPIDVYEWSVWVGNPAQNNLNATRIYRNAMPASVGTTRPVSEGAELARKFAVAPISVIQVFGDPTEDIDIDLRVKKGNVLAHWPQGTERSGGIRWFKSNFLAAPPATIAPGNLPEGHWFGKLRNASPALFVKFGNRVERFLAYDTELLMPIPIKIRGGPDDYTLQNLTGQKLLDVVVIAPVEGGSYRVGWLDSLPTAVPKDTAVEEKEAKAKEAEKKEKEKTKDTPEAKKKAAEAILEAADQEAKDKEKAKEKAKTEPKPLPVEGDANIKARVDQALNRPVTVNVEKAPRKDVLALVAGQARLRYEVDDPTLTKENIDLGQPMSLKGGNLAARDALADVLGTVGLSYRISEDGTLFITTAARLAAETGKKTVIEGPPVKLTLGPPMKPTDPSFREATRDAYVKRLTAQGMRAEVIQTYLDQYGPVFFEPKGLIVLAHLSREAIEEAALLDVFPSPRKLVRTAVVVSHGVDPRLQDQARILIRQLGESAYKARENAENQLFEMGPVAVPVLEDALKDKDVEIVFRAERILMKLNRPVP